MTDSRFASAYAKLDRADKHLAELRELLVAYMSQPDVVTGTMANGPTPQSFRILGAGHEIQAVIGDIAHNLRSALDHVVWQLVLANGGTPKPGGGGTQFPILPEEPKDGSLTVRTDAGGVSPAALKIIEAAQPYSTAADRYDGAPAIVHHISNTDKHREPAVVHRVITGMVSWSGTGDTTQHWSAPLRTANPAVDYVELLLAEVPDVLGDGGAKAHFEVQLELPSVERHPHRGPLYGTLDHVAWEVRRFVVDLEATVVPTLV
jgi:hypothetical protein